MSLFITTNNNMFSTTSCVWHIIHLRKLRCYHIYNENNLINNLKSTAISNNQTQQK